MRSRCHLTRSLSSCRAERGAMMSLPGSCNPGVSGRAAASKGSRTLSPLLLNLVSPRATREPSTRVAGEGSRMRRRCGAISHSRAEAGTQAERHATCPRASRLRGMTAQRVGQALARTRVAGEGSRMRRRCCPNSSSARKRGPRWCGRHAERHATRRGVPPPLSRGQARAGNNDVCHAFMLAGKWLRAANRCGPPFRLQPRPGSAAPASSAAGRSSCRRARTRRHPGWR